MLVVELTETCAGCLRRQLLIYVEIDHQLPKTLHQPVYMKIIKDNNNQLDLTNQVAMCCDFEAWGENGQCAKSSIE